MRLLKALVFLLIFILILGAAAAGAGYVWLTDEIAKPGPSQAVQTFEVKPGEGLISIAARLEQDGLITDARLLRVASRLEQATGQARWASMRLKRG